MITEGARFLFVLVSILGAAQLMATNHFWWGMVIIFVGVTQTMGNSQDSIDKKLATNPTLFSAVLYAIGLTAIIFLVQQNHPWWGLAIGAQTGFVCNAFSDKVDGEELAIYMAKDRKASLLNMVLYGICIASGAALMSQDHPWWGLAVIIVAVGLLTDGIT